MGRIDQTVDMTGKLNLMDMNQQNIEQLIDELNRNSDQLDSLNKGLAVGVKNSIPAPLIGNTYTASVSVGSTNPSSFLAFMSRSDQPGIYFAMPYFLTVGFPITGLQMAAYAQIQSGIAGAAATINFSGSVSNAYLPSAPASVTFYYYLFNQPANPSGL